MQNYYQQQQQQKQQSQIETRRRTRSRYPDDNNANYINYRQYDAQQPIPQHQPSQHSDIDSGKIQIKQPSFSKPIQQRKSNWARKQRIKYYVFLNYYSQIPYWGNELKSIPTYKSLSVFVKTRAPQQCKSYHLSIRRNYKSIQEMLMGLREQLKEQQGFARLVDKYEVDIIAFEMEHKILQSYQLEEKPYFQHKLVERSKGTAENPQQIKYPNATTSRSSHYIIEKQLNQNDQQECNFKINLKDYLDDQQKQQQDKKFEANHIQPTNINTSQNANNTPFNTNSRLSSPYNQHPNIPGAPINFYLPSQMTPPFIPQRPQKNKKIPFENNNITSKPTSNQTNNNSTQPPNNNLSSLTQRMLMQQNYNRFLQANKNLYNSPYQAYNPYQPNPFMAPNPMQFNQPHRSQMPYSIPPPGGIPYLMPGFNDPFSMSSFGPIGANRFGPNILPQGAYPQKQRQSQTENQRQSQIQKLIEEKYKQQSPQQYSSTIDNKINQNYSEKRKQILLECHKHLVNWLRAVSELNKRKQATEKQQNITVNN